VAVWEREVPTGSGITGLWRPEPLPEGASEILEFIGGANSVYSLKQEGGSLTGTVEGSSVNFTGGSDVPAPIIDGKIDGSAVSFKAGNNTYSGSIEGDRIKLMRSINLGWEMPKPLPKPADAPFVGPPPDGSDPSIGDFLDLPPGIPVVLRRAQR
jgi:beta-galactosidase